MVVVGHVRQEGGGGSDGRGGEGGLVDGGGGAGDERLGAVVDLLVDGDLHVGLGDGNLDLLGGEVHQLGGGVLDGVCDALDLCHGGDVGHHGGVHLGVQLHGGDGGADDSTVGADNTSGVAGGANQTMSSNQAMSNQAVSANEAMSNESMSNQAVSNEAGVVGHHDLIVIGYGGGEDRGNHAKQHKSLHDELS